MLVADFPVDGHDLLRTAPGPLKIARSMKGLGEGGERLGQPLADVSWAFEEPLGCLALGNGLWELAQQKVDVAEVAVDIDLPKYVSRYLRERSRYPTALSGSPACIAATPRLLSAAAAPTWSPRGERMDRQALRCSIASWCLPASSRAMAMLFRTIASAVSSFASSVLDSATSRVSSRLR